MHVGPHFSSLHHASWFYNFIYILSRFFRSRSIIAQIVIWLVFAIAGVAGLSGRTCPSHSNLSYVSPDISAVHVPDSRFPAVLHVNLLAISDGLTQTCWNSTCYVGVFTWTMSQHLIKSISYLNGFDQSSVCFRFQFWESVLANCTLNEIADDVLLTFTMGMDYLVLRRSSGCLSPGLSNVYSFTPYSSKCIPDVYSHLKAEHARWFGVCKCGDECNSLYVCYSLTVSKVKLYTLLETSHNVECYLSCINRSVYMLSLHKVVTRPISCAYDGIYEIVLNWDQNISNGNVLQICYQNMTADYFNASINTMVLIDKFDYWEIRETSPGNFSLTFDDNVHYLWIRLVSHTHLVYDSLLGLVYDHAEALARFSVTEFHRLRDLFYFYWKWLTAYLIETLSDLFNPELSVRAGGTNHVTPLRIPVSPRPAHALRPRPHRASKFQPQPIPARSGTSLMISCHLGSAHFTVHPKSPSEYENLVEVEIPKLGHDKNQPTQYEHPFPTRKGSPFICFCLLGLLFALLELSLLLGRDVVSNSTWKAADLNRKDCLTFSKSFRVNHDILVYTMTQGSGSDSDIAKTPNSTPKKSKMLSRLDPSSQPLPKTLSPIWTPSQKITRRMRSFSGGSSISASGSDCNSQLSDSRAPKKSKTSQPKGIEKDGKYELDQKKTCTAQYMSSFLTEEQSDRLFDEISNGIKENFETNKDEWLSVDIEDTGNTYQSSLKEQIKHLSGKVEKALCAVFDVKTNISQVIIRRLRNFKDYIPYETFAGKNGSNPVTVFLTIGAPRVLKLRRGTRPTHHVELHSGTLFGLAGKTSLEYSHSIAKGKANFEFEQITLTFIGSPEEGTSDINSPLASGLKSETESELSEDTADEPTEINEEEVPNRNHTGPNTPDECEQTMIHMGTETAKKPPKQDADHTWLHSLIENSIIDLKTEMEKLTDEMTQLKLIVGETSQPNSNEARASNLEKQARKLNDLWEKNLSATSRIQNLINQVFTDINIAELRTSEVDNHLQRLKMDLKNYYNSAFFKEDSKLIKEIHAALCKAPARGTTANAQYPVVTEPSLGNFPVHPSRMPQLTPVTELQSRRGPGFTVTHSQSQGRTSNNMQDHTHVLTQGAEPHNTATASAAPQGQDERQPNTPFKTVLITDSILRHVQGSANVLGVNHELKVINKRDTSGLKEKKVLETLEEYKPDFVYVHLGLN
ncbi:hypothetical protein ACHWQZ_G017170 [Mnemiopsis leidyi]